MTSEKKAYSPPTLTNADPSTGIVVYTHALEPQEVRVREAALECDASLKIVNLPGFKITSKEVYETISKTWSDAKDHIKFFDDERKVSVTPLNREVDRINDWYKPALDGYKKIVSIAERLMANYVLEKKAEEKKLLEEARVAAQAVLNTNPDVTNASGGAAMVQATATLVQQAAATAPPKVVGMSEGKEMWTYVVINAEALVKAHPELSMPDPKKIKAWVEKNGNKNVPVGVEVKEDVSFRKTKK